MTQKDDLLAEIASLKSAAQDYVGKLQDAKVRELIIDSKIAELGDELKNVAADVDWDTLGDAIEKAAKVAQDAVQALTDALEAAGVEQ